MKRENTKIEREKNEWSNENDVINVSCRTIILEMVPFSFDTEICKNFLNGMLLSILGNSNGSLTTSKYVESVTEVNLVNYTSNNCSNKVDCNVSTNYKSFRVTLTSVLATLLCLKLDDIPIGSKCHKIVCRRVDEYTCNSSEILDYFTIPNILEFNNSEIVNGVKCIISSLPMDVNEDYIRSELENFGKLKYFKILYDPITGVSNGTGLFEFEEVNSSQKAISTLNGKKIDPTKEEIWNIQRETLKLNTNNYKIQDNTEYTNASNLHSSISYKLFENPIICLLMKYSKIIGETPSKVVKLNNVFFPEEVMDDKTFNSTIDSVKSEAEKYGTIIEITSPRPRNINEYNSYGGSVFIYFSDITSARRAQYQFNGRVFDSIKIISATFYPTEKYLNHEYNLISFIPE
ncbi:splicing factor U2AF U2 auxiliary factor large subunit [Cryptosporidium xiaoi]|uniref:Splicing factor U2AF U2 auxiliary factor large subunit n=1 Tax=Cryptosporidium xiaoi TaxID=659607 RepID=A0AAV9YC38_9CRYT